MMGDFSATFTSVMRDFHIYQAVWSPVVHEELSTQQKHGNPEDRYASPRNAKLLVPITKCRVKIIILANGTKNRRSFSNVRVTLKTG